MSTTLEALAPNVWSCTGSVKLLPGAHLPTRMTVIKLGDGSVLLHSPIPIDDDLAARLTAIGPVRHVVAPNRMHHSHTHAALERFDGARCYAADGVREANSTLRVDAVLGRGSPPFTSDVDLLEIAGAPKLSEWVLRHRSSGTLITTDLLFNVQQPRGWLTPWVLRAAGTYRRLAISRFVKRLVEDETAFSQSLTQLTQEPINHLVMSHGDVISERTSDRLREALSVDPVGGT